MLRFCFGPSGAGKSRRLFEEVIQESLAAGEQGDCTKQFLIVVPDQYTLQVQRDVVALHPRHAISDIDVLSFSRLSHRIFDEVGGPEVPVLDDMGKTLVLRHVASQIPDRLPVLGPRMHLPGFVDEVKSLFSEFLQYCISPDDLDGMIAACTMRGALAARLKDLQTLYRAFEDYKRGHYVAAEETMAILAQKIPESSLVRDAVVVFDGFTGFTPIQYRVLSSVMKTAAMVTFSLLADPAKDPRDRAGAEAGIFGLTARTVAALEERAKAEDIKIADDIFISERPVRRLKDNPALAFLEEQLFRGGAAHYSDDPGDAVMLWEAADPAAECTRCCLTVSRLLREDPSLRYEDIAVLCTDPETYMPLMERIGQLFDIPLYLDRTEKVQMNPLVECMESALGVLTDHYSPASVFRFLRCPLSGFTPEETDRLQIYAESMGVRGRKRWQEPFIRVSGRHHSVQEEKNILDALNASRERFIGLMEPFHETGRRDVRSICITLVNLFDALGAQEKLKTLAFEREKAGDVRGRRSCEQIYEKVIGLMEQMVSLLGGQKMSLKTFGELLRTGLDKITVGMIPGGIDRLLVGDLERTRLGEKKVVFLLGVNDTLLPKAGGGGGLLNDLDRRFLAGAVPGVELAPDGPMRLLDEREYLYMNLTKPSRSLILSWSLVGMDGRSMRPSDLIRRLKALFPALTVHHDGEECFLDHLETAGNAEAYLAANIRYYAEALLSEEEERSFVTLFRTLAQAEDDRGRLKLLAETAFYRYEPKPLRPETGQALYGEFSEGSVSRLELFAACPFAHFAGYGLGLREQERFEMRPADLGTIYHGILEDFDAALAAAGRTWKDFSEEEAAGVLQSLLDTRVADVRNGVLLSNNRYRYMQHRILRILKQTVHTIRFQLDRGEFLPILSEWDFHESVNGVLLKGRVDRVDLCAREDRRYLRIVDFKSGAHVFEPALFTQGIQLQLMLYLSAVCRAQERAYPDASVVPAGIFYYHVNDPLLSVDANTITADIERQRNKGLMLKGLANSDREAILLMDRTLAAGGSSDILPVGIKRDGELTAHTTAITGEDFGHAVRYMNETIASTAGMIKGGSVEIAPYKYKNRTACTWCEYRGICGFDRRIPGYKLREIAGMNQQEMMQRIKP